VLSTRTQANNLGQSVRKVRRASQGCEGNAAPQANAGRKANAAQLDHKAKAASLDRKANPAQLDRKANAACLDREAKAASCRAPRDAAAGCEQAFAQCVDAFAGSGMHLVHSNLSKEQETKLRETFADD